MVEQANLKLEHCFGGQSLPVTTIEVRRTEASFWGQNLQEPMIEDEKIEVSSSVQSFEVQTIWRTMEQLKIEEQCFSALRFWEQNFGEQMNGYC